MPLKHHISKSHKNVIVSDINLVGLCVPACVPWQAGWSFGGKKKTFRTAS